MKIDSHSVRLIEFLHYLCTKSCHDMETRRYPIGIQTFSEIITGNYVYVDKTKYVYDITQYKYVFLSRPRRFGKSLLTTTLESYFLGRKELFKGLAIDSLETEWKTYPVLHFDMSWAKLGTIENISAMIDSQLVDYEKKYGISKSSEDFGVRLKGLIVGCAQKYGEKTVVLIDEYDSQLLNVIDEPEKLKDVRNFIRSFYAPLKACDEYLRFVFITGITKFSQLSIFSELNNLTNISMVPKFSAICGISQREIESQLMDDIHRMSEKLKISQEEALALLKRTYDGYHFSEDAEDIYNPFSLINALNDSRVNNYWDASGTPTFLTKTLKHFNTDFTEIDGSIAAAEDFDAPTEAMTSMLPLLYQSGYLTIKDYDSMMNLYTLGFPNQEVRIGMLRSFIPYFITNETAKASVEIARIYADLLHDDMNSALTRLKVFMATVPYFAHTKSEGHYQSVIYIILSLLGQYIQSEVRTATGRIDAVLKTSTHIYVMEFKLDKSVEEAIAQIDTKDYLLPYTLDNRKLVKVGINFSSETRTLDNWIIQEANSARIVCNRE